MVTSLEPEAAEESSRGRDEKSPWNLLSREGEEGDDERMRRSERGDTRDQTEEAGSSSKE
eukprot:767484-Hanusia_phi.AAC.5